MRLVGGATAGLTGLLFVAVSIRIDFIARSQELRNRAAQTLALSILLLIAGVLVAAGVHAGLYVLVVPVLVALAGGVVSAWLLLTKIVE